MGMFDSVLTPCPKCSVNMEFQSKAWNCDMDVYTIENAPAAILWDIINDPQYHRECGQWVALVDPDYPSPHRRPKPKLTAAKVNPPDNPETHFQGFKWWPDGLDFTYADLTDGPPRKE